MEIETKTERKTERKLNFKRKCVVKVYVGGGGVLNSRTKKITKDVSTGMQKIECVYPAAVPPEYVVTFSKKINVSSLLLHKEVLL